MDDSAKLYFRLCSEFNISSKTQQEQIVNLLDKYILYSKQSTDNLSELVKTFLTAKEASGASQNTIANYSCSINKFIKYVNNNKISNIDKNAVRQFLTSIDNRKSTTVNQYLQRLKSFYNWCAGEDLIHSNPTIGTFYKVRKEQKHGLTKDEINRVKANCVKERDAVLINFLLSTGCRVSEVCDLKFDDLNLIENYARVTGKGNKTRLVLFNNNTRDMLETLKNQAKNSQYVFSSLRTPYGKIERFTVEKLVRNLGKKAGLSYQLHPHMFRHTFATNCLENGMNLISIQKLLGHSDLATTAVYAESSYKVIKEKYNEIFN